MGRKKQARILRIQQEQRNKDEGHLDWFLTNCLFLIAVIGLNFIPFFLDVGTDSYNHTQNGILVVFILALLSFLLRKNANNHMYKSVRKMLFEKKKLNLYEKGDIVLALTYFSALISFFLIDFSFLKSYGLKISAVAAVSIFELLRRNILNRKKKT